MKQIMLKILIALFTLSLISCDDDKDVNDPDTEENNNILVVNIVPNPSGQSGTGYMQLINNLDEKALTNKTAIPIPMATPTVIGNDIFVLSGWTQSNNIMKKYTRINGKLVKQGEYQLPTNAGATHVVTKGDLAYVSCVFIGKILIVNHKTMKLVQEIDITSYAVGDQNPDPSIMILRDNLLFVTLWQAVGGYLADINRPYADVLIINTDNNQVVKMITDSTSGLSLPSRPVDPNSVFMDDNKNIYISCIGSFGAFPTHKAGLLRIKAGETEFDTDYNFVYNTTPIEGESNPLNFIQSIKYVGNNKAYGTANIPTYGSNPPDYIKDKTNLSVEIDLVNKTIKKIDIPASNSFGVAVGLVNNQVIFGLGTANSTGFFTYNSSTGKGSSKAIITTEGFPFLITELK